MICAFALTYQFLGANSQDSDRANDHNHPTGISPRCERADPEPRNPSKEETMRNRIAGTLTALALSMSPIAGAQAFTNGWNFIGAGNCAGGPAFGTDFVFIYPTTGGQLSTTDAVTVSLIAPLCASGDGFYVFLNGTNWIATSVYPGIK
jgi:hypothetical protein